MTKLNETQVVEMRERYAAGETIQHIADDYPVHWSHVHHIVTGRYWADAGGPIDESSGRKLTADDARAIRASYTGEYGEKSRLAEEYGVSQPTISQILNGEIYPED